MEFRSVSLLLPNTVTCLQCWRKSGVFMSNENKVYVLLWPYPLPVFLSLFITESCSINSVQTPCGDVSSNDSGPTINNHSSVLCRGSRTYTEFVLTCSIVKESHLSLQIHIWYTKWQSLNTWRPSGGKVVTHPYLKSQNRRSVMSFYRCTDFSGQPPGERLIHSWVSYQELGNKLSLEATT